jgi:hypothetical protein
VGAGLRLSGVPDLAASVAESAFLLKAHNVTSASALKRTKFKIFDASQVLGTPWFSQRLAIGFLQGVQAVVHQLRTQFSASRRPGPASRATFA